MLNKVTQLLTATASGDAVALRELYAAVYDELHRMAVAQMRRESGAHTLQPTALVNEAYLRLAEGANAWENRRHFFGAAARAMRQVLVDHARRRDSQKRGAELVRVTFSGLELGAPGEGFDLIAVDQALDALTRDRPRLAQLLELRLFTGMSVEDCARVLGCAPATVKRDWAYAKAWLLEEIGAGG